VGKSKASTAAKPTAAPSGKPVVTPSAKAAKPQPPPAAEEEEEENEEEGEEAAAPPLAKPASAPPAAAKPGPAAKPTAGPARPAPTGIGPRPAAAGAPSPSGAVPRRPAPGSVRTAAAPGEPASSHPLIASVVGTATSRLRPAPASLAASDSGDEESEPRRTGLIIGLVILLLLLAGGGYYYWYIKNKQESGNAPAKHATAVPAQAPLKLDVVAGTTDAERAQNFIKLILTEMTDLHNAYQKRFNEAGFSAVLNPDRVAKDEGFHETRDMLAKMSQMAGENRSKALEKIDAAPRRLEAVALNTSMKPEVAQNCRKELGRVSALLRETWDLETTATDYLTDVVNLLQGTRDHWTPENGKFSFQRAVDLDRFNEMMEKIKARILRQNEIQQQLSIDAGTDSAGQVTRASS
jgi:hypothetical protein